MKSSNILVPIDFSDESRQALLEAATLADVDTRLTLVHVRPLEAYAFLDFTYTESPQHLAEACEAAQRNLRQWAQEHAPDVKTVDCKVVTGQPALEIVNLTQENDLVVMSTHGRTGVGHFLIGSVAERVVQRSACSVLIVKTANSGDSDE